MKTSNASSYFNVYAPGADEATFNGSSGGDAFSGRRAGLRRLRVQVYMMRNAARRNETASYTLMIGAGASPVLSSRAPSSGPGL